ncbi:TauD/TfdA family dioxygenase [Nocardia farcinica]|uniref:TauD/TfdA family dioxygenase n=1 Tax=Nocardia farcinica TaxID=37329 RepID=UPI002453DB24|nr:TauD/TfdA family dioxygenase [Nocardia farcinica]
MTLTSTPTPLSTSGFDRVRDYIANLPDPAAWDGPSLLARRDSWELALTPEQADLLSSLVEQATAKYGLWSNPETPIEAWREITAPMAEFFERAEASLEGGTGIALLRNLPVRRDNAHIEYNENLLWLIGTRLGQPVNQMGGGTLLARLQDLRGGHRGRDVRPENTNEPLKHHTDGSDLLMLMCVRQATEGGNSFISSSVRTVQEIARRHPELLAPLLEDHFAFDRNEEQPAGDDPYYLTKLCTIVADKISVRYSREMIETAQHAPGAPQLTERQRRLLDVFDEIAAEGGAEIDFRSGDMMIVNNYSVLHARSTFSDPEEVTERRLLVRLWLAMSNGRPLPFDFDRGVNHDPAGRGGVPYKNPA